MQKYVLKRIYAFPEFYNLEIMQIISRDNYLEIMQINEN